MNQSIEKLKAEINELNNILFIAVESFKIVEYLSKMEDDLDKSYIKNKNGFFRYVLITNWRITVIELCKLLSGGKNEANDLRRFINKLRPEGEFGHAGISSAKIKEWQEKLSKEKTAINNLVIQRNKVYAHTDREASSIRNQVTIEKAKELIFVAQLVVKEIYLATFNAGFSFDAVNSPVNNLKWIVNSLTTQKKERDDALKSLTLQHGIKDEF